jgi:hypothetical protein
MTQQTINIGTSANDKTGDPLRVAFAKVNANFDELYAAGGGGGGASVTESNVPPNAPNVGDLWYDTNGGRMYVFYDHNWVDTSPLPNAPVISSLTNSSYTLSVNSDGTISVPENVEISNTSLINFASPVFGIFTANNWINMDDPGNNLTSAIEFLTSRNVHNFKWTMGADGTLNIPVTVDGSAIVQATSHIKIISAGKTWSFANDGNLTIPDGGDIRNIHGTSVLGGGGATDRLTSNGHSAILDSSGVLTVPGAINGGAELRLRINGANDWVFYGGYLTLSNGTIIDDNIDGSLRLSVLADPSGYHEWKLGRDSSTTFPNGSKLDGGVAYKFATDNSVTQYIDLRDTSGRGFYTDGSGYTLRSSGGKSWVFDTNGVVTLPGAWSQNPATFLAKAGIQLNKTYQSNRQQSTLELDANGSVSISTGMEDSDIPNTRHAWYFVNDGRTIFPTSTVPTHSTGASGDRQGMVVFDGNYIYYCKENYSNGVSDIWVRSAWTSTSW